jgi:hypothetical protein
LIFILFGFLTTALITLQKLTTRILMPETPCTNT